MGRKATSEYNLAVIHPKVAKEWHPTKNKSLFPEDFTPGTSKKVWWKCNQGHEWNARVNFRARRGTGCPTCALKNKKRTIPDDKRLSFTNPELAKEWHPTKNGDLLPEHFSYGTTKKVWWKCNQGHEWNAIVNSRARGHKCPICALKYRKKTITDEKRLSFTNPELAKEWHPTKNGDLLPEHFSFGSNKKVWWKCNQDHEWQTQIGHRTIHNTQCPYCSGRLATKESNLETKFPELSKEWHPTKNGDLKPKGILPHSKKQIWWLCEKGHEWRAPLHGRTRGNNCPTCNNYSTSLPEIRVFSELQSIFDNVHWRKKLDGMEVDVLISDFKLAIEYDGVHWHSGKEDKDRKKNFALKKLGINLLRVREEPLDLISDFDVLVDRHTFKKGDMNKLLESASDLVKKMPRDKISEYIQSKDFWAEDTYREIVSYLPDPTPSRSLASLNPKVAKEWHPTKNSPLRPENFYLNSDRKVWWLCLKGHEWESMISNRTRQKSGCPSGCPYCSGKLVSPAHNLEKLYPELAREWHPTKNDQKMPSLVLPSGRKKVWWLCSKGHEWEALCGNRIRSKHGCPYCSGKLVSPENNFAKAYPDQAKEWHPTKNGDLSPQTVARKSNKKVWWLCSKGHEWQAIISNRTIEKNGCPFCWREKNKKNKKLLTKN
jgi:hypothetical protein